MKTASVLLFDVGDPDLIWVDFLHREEGFNYNDNDCYSHHIYHMLSVSDIQVLIND